MIPENFPEFRFTLCFRPFPQALEVKWSIVPTAYDLEDIRYVIFRSTGAAGPWEQIGVAEPGSYAFTDNDVQSPGVLRTYYYIVRAASTTGKGYRDSAPFYLVHAPTNIALEMVRKKRLYLHMKGGIGVAVFPRKSWGAKCSRCWNPQRGTANDSDCHECLGTGFTGGYLNPVFTPALMNPPKKLIIETGMPYDPANQYMELANHPLLRPKDLLVDTTMNFRYSVEQITLNTHLMHPVSQIALVLRVDENSVLYNLTAPPPPHAADGHSWDLTP